MFVFKAIVGLIRYLSCQWFADVLKSDTDLLAREEMPRRRRSQYRSENKSLLLATVWQAAIASAALRAL